MIPEIEQCDLGGDWVEGYFRIGDISAYLALQVGLPYETIRARVIEAYGYCKRPPATGERIILMQSGLEHVDELSIRAMQRVIDDFISAEEIEAIKSSYLASEFGDAYWIAWDLHIHVYMVIAVLRNLRTEGSLPELTDWGA